jgi:hypothetical protein
LRIIVKFSSSSQMHEKILSDDSNFDRKYSHETHLVVRR